MSMFAAMGRSAAASPRLKARIAGLCYLLIFVAAPSGAGTATPTRMLVTLACDTAVAFLFFDLFKPLSRRLSLIAALFRLAFVAIMAGVSLNYFGYATLLGTAHSETAFTTGYELALVPFGAHCLLVGCLVYGSAFLPRILGVLMVGAGLGWLTFLSPPLADLLYPYILVPGVLGEGSLTLWLLVVGLDAQRWHERAGAASLA